MKNKKLFAILTLVCFMFTLMPVAAFADTTPGLDVVQNSYIYAEDTEVDKNEEVELTIDAKVAQATTVYVWFEETANVPSTALVGANEGILEVVTDAKGDATTEVTFNAAGTYELHASFKKPVKATTWAEGIADLADYELQTQANYKTVVVSADAAKSSKYVIKFADGTIVKDGKSTTINAVGANGIDETAVNFTVYEDEDAAKANNADKVVYAYNVEVEGSSKVSVNDVKAKRSGVVTFDVVAEKAGTHKVTVKIGDFNATIKVDANEGEAEEIEVAYVNQTPVNIDAANDTGLHGYLLFEIFDANGNELNAEYDDVTGNLTVMNDSGFNKATGTYQVAAGENIDNYVSIVEQPAKSDIKNKDLTLIPSAKDENGGWTVALAAAKDFEEEGDYTFKVALNDGTFAKATLTLKEAGDPVALSLSYNTDSVQLGAKIAPKSVGWLDANYVFTNGYEYVNNKADSLKGELEIVASGAAVEDVDNLGVITVKGDEKYIGSEILVTVVDEENNLIVTKTLTVAAEAKELVFDTKNVPVDTTRTIGVKLVDEDGKTVSLTNATAAEAYVVVLAKPADCDVTAEAGNVSTGYGTFNINFSADAIGAVTIQAVLKATVNENNKDVVRYYTGTQTITVGADGFEDVVVMSIGSKEIVVNDAVKAIDAAPMVENNRTFVPFRALVEAFGATVAYDEATQAVTAELNDVTVVMTIGSATYTVNGVEKTADVAPFINDSRTMIPVRFVAQEFGITVTPTYDDNGATADVVFAK